MLPATSIRQRFPGVLVDHRQTFELLSIRAGIEHEVVSPDGMFAVPDRADWRLDDAGVCGALAGSPCYTIARRGRHIR